MNLISVARISGLPDSATVLDVSPWQKWIKRFFKEALFSSIRVSQFYALTLNGFCGGKVRVIIFFAFTYSHPANIAIVIEFAGIDRLSISGDFIFIDALGLTSLCEGPLSAVAWPRSNRNLASKGAFGSMAITLPVVAPSAVLRRIT